MVSLKGWFTLKLIVDMF